MKPSVLTDSGFLYALFVRKDSDHERVRHIFQTTKASFIIPQVVLTEVAFLCNRVGGQSRVAEFLDFIYKAQLPLQDVSYSDLQRAAAILRHHGNSRIDFVDCCIVALSDRLAITQVATLDIRDFSILRRADGMFMEILR